MQSKTRLWLGLGAAVLVGGTNPPGSSPAIGAPPPAADPSPRITPATAAPAVAVLLAQVEAGSLEGGEGGEGEGGEGGGSVLGTITEFRLGSTDPNAFRYDAGRQVATYAAVVHDSYVAAHAGALKLQETVAALLANPSDQTLAAARAAWIAGRAAYTQTEPFLFYAGPIDGENGPLSRINAFPVNEAFLDYVQGKPGSGIVNDPAVPMNRATLVELDQAADPANVTTGWHAIEFLLWGQDLSATGPGARPASDYAAGTGNTDRRRDYLRIVTQLLVLDLSTLVAAWAPDNANNYRESILAMDQRNALGRAFNGMAVLAGYEIGLKRIGISLRQTDEQFEQSRFSDNTTADNANSLRGIRNVYFGSVGATKGVGFDVLLAAIDPALNTRVVAAFDRAEKAIAALPAQYDSILASPKGSPSRAAAGAAVTALKDLADALRAAGNRLGVLVVIPGV